MFEQKGPWPFLPEEAPPAETLHPASGPGPEKI